MDEISLKALAKINWDWMCLENVRMDIMMCV